MVQCEKCGLSLPDEYRFCTGCGAAAPEPEPASREIICPRCARVLKGEYRFCTGCGLALAHYREYKDPLESAAEKFKEGGTAVKRLSQNRLAKSREALHRGSAAVKASVAGMGNPLNRFKRKVMRIVFWILLFLVIALGLAVFVLLRFRPA